MGPSSAGPSSQGPSSLEHSSQTPSRSSPSSQGPSSHFAGSDTLIHFVSGQVAFTSAATESTSYAAGETVRFPDVISNIGGGFIPGTNEFICPQSGVYFFSTSLYCHGSDMYTAGIWLDDAQVLSLQPDSRWVLAGKRHY